MPPTEDNASTIAGMIQADRWAVAEVAQEVGPAIIRYRQPVLGPLGVASHGNLLVILWAYADEETGELPDEETIAEMDRFEDTLCGVVETDTLAALAAVLTFDGARQWVFYTRDLEHFIDRLTNMPDFHGEPYPIELSADEDPEWSYLRDQILEDVTIQ